MAGALAAIEDAGGGLVEAYPEQVEGRPPQRGAYFHTGPENLFEAFGFERDRRIAKWRWVMRRRFRAVADADDVRRLALALPHVVEIPSAGFDFRVADRGFVWSYPERRPGRPRVIRTDVAVLFVGDEEEKQALLLGEPDLFFTAAGYENAPLVMLRLAEVDVDRLGELVTDAWRMRAPAELVARPRRRRSLSRLPAPVEGAPVAVSAGWGGRPAPGCVRRGCGSRAARGRSRPPLRRPGPGRARR